MKYITAFLFVIFSFSATALSAEPTSPKPQRIVSLTLGTDEILLSLVDPLRIVAITQYASDPGISNVSDLASVIPTQIKHPSVEVIVALQPDLILAASYTTHDLVQQLNDLGLPVLTLTIFSSIEGIEKNIRTIGRRLGEPKQAEALIIEMKARLKSVSDRISEIENRPGLLSYSLEGWTSGKETTFDEIVTLAGGRNLAAEAGIVKSPKISLEAVLEWNPDILILNAWQPEDSNTNNKKLLAHPALQTVSAVKTGKVYSVPGKYLTSVSHFIVDGVEFMARLLHPKRFPINSSNP